MAVDLTKLALHTGYPAFKNNREYTGTLTISGSTDDGANTRTFDIELDQEPDLLDITFNGNSDSGDSRPDDAEFKSGVIWVPSSGSGNPQPWYLSYSVNGTTLTITASYLAQFIGAETLTSTPFTYRVADYSVF